MEHLRFETECIGQTIRSFLEKQNLSLRDVERETGISKSTMSRNLKMGSGFTDVQLVRLSKLFDVSLSTIILKAEESVPDQSKDG